MSDELEGRSGFMSVREIARVRKGEFVNFIFLAF